MTDPDTELVHFSARDYDPQTGRFMTLDPSGLQGGLNEYTYVSGDPINKIDPYGLDSTAWNVIATIDQAVADATNAATGGAVKYATGKLRGEKVACLINDDSLAAQVGGLIGPGGKYKTVEELEEAARAARALKQGERDVDAALDATGKVHGTLPNPGDLNQYDREELERLRDQLDQSVQQRIQKTNEYGSDPGHGDRQAEEQQLIQSIDKHLKDR